MEVTLSALVFAAPVAEQTVKMDLDSKCLTELNPNKKKSCRILWYVATILLGLLLGNMQHPDRKHAGLM